MARRRMIHPKFWQSRHWVRVDRFRARLLFIGIFSNADDEGRLIGLAQTLRANIFPHDKISDDAIEDDLKLLAAEGLIVRYMCESVPYIQVVKWKEHQRIDHPQRSHFPALEQGNLFLEDTSGIGESVNQIDLTEGNDDTQIDSENGSKNDSKNGSESGSIPIESNLVKPREKRGNLPDGSYRTFSKRIMKGAQFVSFQKFWNDFDYKHDKAKAADAWLDIDWPESRQGKNDLFKLIIKKAKATAVNREYVERKGTPPYAAKWLSHRRWEDD